MAPGGECVQALDHGSAVTPVTRQRQLLADAAIAARDIRVSHALGARRLALSPALEPAFECIPFG